MGIFGSQLIPNYSQFIPVIEYVVKQPVKNEPAVDLNRLLNGIYERARFDLAIDYSIARFKELD
ncbi:DUF4058 family protein [Anabaena sp. PCC 7938]|uniref:DUF4058 family protein n=1 Tax=Anabaena TaxID=1163 RepID=UPI00030D179F|nr:MULTISPECIES: DUF4058 family protein [Anabaena]MCM2406290.1 DUF4058 family protein [Anabaena sp. CCAP 1446/1C]BAY03345.1 hypothetical protein NIES19_25980 [Anabaena cylindrica PCC 7122]